MVDLPPGATGLPRDSHSVRAFFLKACLLEHADTIRLPHGLRHALMRVPQSLCCIPPPLTAQPLSPTDRPPLDAEGHGLARLASARTPGAHHIVKAMGTRLPACQTVVASCLALPACLQAPCYSARAKVGMAKPAPAVRQAGSLRGLLVIRRVDRRRVPRSCCQIQYKCRCRGK